MATRFEYRYRDASNFKVHGCAILNGDLTAQEIEAVRSCLAGDGFFIAEQLGLPALCEQLYRWSDGPTEADHCWHEFVDIVVVRDGPSDEYVWGDAREFVSKLLAVREWKGELSPNFWLDV